MPLLRDEAEKLSNNELEQGVIETIIDRDDLFAVLPFMKINSKAYLYNREATLSEATFIDVNDTITEGAATFTEHVAKLRILAGDVDVDQIPGDHYVRHQQPAGNPGSSEGERSGSRIPPQPDSGRLQHQQQSVRRYSEADARRSEDRHRRRFHDLLHVRRAGRRGERSGRRLAS